MKSVRTSYPMVSQSLVRVFGKTQEAAVCLGTNKLLERME